MSGVDGAATPAIERDANVEVEAVDHFIDVEVSKPYPYFDALRSRRPVQPMAHPKGCRGAEYVEVVEVSKDAWTFHPASLSGDLPATAYNLAQQITDVIEAHRHEWPMSEFMITMDGAAHFCTAQTYCGAC